jgi:hypothetical protein
MSCDPKLPPDTGDRAGIVMDVNIKDIVFFEDLLRDVCEVFVD